MSDHRFVFTRHAVERYIQFHLLDRDEQRTDWRDVAATLNQHATEAYRLPHPTKHGHPQWRIDALGCDLVTKPDGADNIIVTILPPQVFRGLRPDQAERVAESAAEATKRAAALLQEQQTLRNKQRKATAKHAAPEVRAEANKHNDRISELKELRALAEVEREVLVAQLKAMHAQQPSQSRIRDKNRIEHLNGEIAHLKYALRIALRALRDGSDPLRALCEVAAVEPGLTSDEFIDGGAQ